MAKNILIVDDNPDILEAVSFLLTDAGYQVTAEERGEYAENLKKPNLPDIIILDVLLSGKDGREITKKLRGKTDTKHIPIILISAHPEAAASALQCGANEFIPKPFDTEDLLQTIEKYINI